MLYIILFLSIIAAGSFIWTIIQTVKPDWFYKAEFEANIKKERPWWYLVLAIIGLVFIVIIWIQAFQLKLISVWILTGILTLGSIKGIGIVFFYDKFSSGVTNYIGHLKDNKKAYIKLVLGRAFLTIVTTIAALYYAGIFGQVV